MSTKREQPAACWRCNGTQRIHHGASDTWQPCFECVPVGEWAAADKLEKARQHANPRSLQRMVRRIPVDFRAVAEEAGLKRGKLCHSPIFGWCVQNTHGDPGPDVATITAPELAAGEVRLAVEEGHWCFYAPNDPSSATTGAPSAPGKEQA